MSVEFQKLVDKVSMYIDVEIFDEYETGIRAHLMNYIQNVSPDKTIADGGTLSVSEELLTDNYIRKYLEKNDRNDFSARDCAFFVLTRYNVPPKEYMSVDSLEKKIRELFKEQKECVYIKRSRGKGNAICVDRNTAEKLLLHPEVTQLLKKQIVKAESNHDDTVEWRAYEIAKKKIEYLDSLSMEDDYNSDYVSGLTEDKKNKLMLEAIYNSLFSAFDFDKYEKYCDELAMLDENWNFGERYQELIDVFKSPDYKKQFYDYKVQDGLLDVLADKIAEKIIEKMQKKES